MRTGCSNSLSGRGASGVIVSVVSLLLALLVGCEPGASTENGSVSSGSGDDVRVERDQAFTEALLDLSAKRGSARLSDLTSFEWDTVHVFSEGASRQQLQEIVGVPVLQDRRYYDAGNLLLFLQDGAATRAISVVPDLLVARPTQGFGTDTELVPHGPATPSLLLLRAP